MIEPHKLHIIAMVPTIPNKQSVRPSVTEVMQSSHIMTLLSQFLGIHITLGGQLETGDHLIWLISVMGGKYRWLNIGY